MNDGAYVGFDEQGAARDLLDRWGATAAQEGHPLWFQLRGDRGGLVTRQLSYPNGLLGRVVPIRWTGVAVVATGRFRLLDEAHEPPAAMIPGFAGGLALACVLSRRGVIGWRLTLPDGSYLDPVPEEGFMMDVLRRSLALDTPPPPESTVGLQLAAWMCAIPGVAAEEARKLGWEEALRLHPALVDGPHLDSAEAETIVGAGDRQADWDIMRRLAAAGLDAEIMPPPDLATWMDAGMFARWVLGRLPTVNDMLPAMRESLEPDAYRRLCHLARKLENRATVG
jgi:hypothetical protein